MPQFKTDLTFRGTKTSDTREDEEPEMVLLFEDSDLGKATGFFFTVTVRVKGKKEDMDDLLEKLRLAKGCRVALTIGENPQTRLTDAATTPTKPAA
jgi:hypothetical protein